MWIKNYYKAFHMKNMQTKEIQSKEIKREKAGMREEKAFLHWVKMTKYSQSRKEAHIPVSLCTRLSSLRRKVWTCLGGLNSRQMQGGLRLRLQAQVRGICLDLRVELRKSLRVRWYRYTPVGKDRGRKTCLPLFHSMCKICYPFDKGNSATSHWIEPTPLFKGFRNFS